MHNRSHTLETSRAKAVAKKRKRVERGRREELRAAKWSRDLWRSSAKPSSYTLMLPLLETIDRRGGAVRPGEIYDEIAGAVGVADELRVAEETFANGRTTNLWRRQVRFAKEEAKRRGFVVRPERGVWVLTEKAQDVLQRARPGVLITVFETALGQALWAKAETAVGALEDSSVDLLFTSPIYPQVADKRGYGTMAVADWLEWMTALAGAWRRVV